MLGASDLHDSTGDILSDQLKPTQINDSNASPADLLRVQPERVSKLLHVVVGLSAIDGRVIQWLVEVGFIQHWLHVVEIGSYLLETAINFDTEE